MESTKQNQVINGECPQPDEYSGTLDVDGVPRLHDHVGKWVTLNKFTLGVASLAPSDQHFRLKDAEAATDVENETHYR